MKTKILTFFLFFFIFPSVVYAVDVQYYATYQEANAAKVAVWDSYCSVENPCTSEWAYRPAYDLYGYDISDQATGGLKALFLVGDEPEPPCADADGDEICDDVDNCVYVSNPNQSDVDLDGVGDVCDNCVDVYNPMQFDFNEDGIGTACDENESFEWRLQQYQKDENGDYTWVRIEFSNGDLWDFGVQDIEKLDYVVINSQWHDRDTLPDWLDAHLAGDTDTGDGDPAGDDDGNEPTDGDSDIVDSGVEGGGTDTEILQNIESNTASTADNFQVLENTLSALDIDLMRVGDNVDNVVDGVQDLNLRLGDIDSSLGDIDSNIDAVQSDIQALPDDIVTAQEESAQSEIVTQNSYLDGVGSGTYGGYVDTDIPDTAESQTSYESAVSDIQNSSDLASVKAQVGVELSGSVSSVSCQAFGSQIAFDFGKYDSIYSMMGVAWLSLCYLFGFFLIVRG